MPTKRQIYICCHLAIEEYLASGKTCPSIDELAKLAKVYGCRYKVSKKQCKDMLSSPMFEVLKWPS